jgi:hypothetical protein
VCGSSVEYLDRFVPSICKERETHGTRTNSGGRDGKEGDGTAAQAAGREGGRRRRRPALRARQAAARGSGICSVVRHSHSTFIFCSVLLFFSLLFSSFRFPLVHHFPSVSFVCLFHFYSRLARRTTGTKQRPANINHMDLLELDPGKDGAGFFFFPHEPTAGSYRELESPWSFKYLYAHQRIFLPTELLNKPLVYSVRATNGIGFYFCLKKEISKYALF